MPEPTPAAPASAEPPKSESASSSSPASSSPSASSASPSPSAEPLLDGNLDHASKIELGCKMVSMLEGVCAESGLSKADLLLKIATIFPQAYLAKCAADKVIATKNTSEHPFRDTIWEALPMVNQVLTGAMSVATASRLAMHRHIVSALADSCASVVATHFAEQSGAGKFAKALWNGLPYASSWYTAEVVKAMKSTDVRNGISRTYAAACEGVVSVKDVTKALTEVIAPLQPKISPLRPPEIPQALMHAAAAQRLAEMPGSQRALAISSKVAGQGAKTLPGFSLALDSLMAGQSLAAYANSSQANGNAALAQAIPSVLSMVGSGMVVAQTRPSVLRVMGPRAGIIGICLQIAGAAAETAVKAQFPPPAPAHKHVP